MAGTPELAGMASACLMGAIGTMAAYCLKIAGVRLRKGPSLPIKE